MLRMLVLLFSVGFALSSSNTLFELKETTNQKLTVAFNLKDYEVNNNGEYSTIMLHIKEQEH